MVFSVSMAVTKEYGKLSALKKTQMWYFLVQKIRIQKFRAVVKGTAYLVPLRSLWEESIPLSFSAFSDHLLETPSFILKAHGSSTLCFHYHLNFSSASESSYSPLIWNFALYYISQTIQDKILN